VWERRSHHSIHLYNLALFFYHFDTVVHLDGIKSLEF